MSPGNTPDCAAIRAQIIANLRFIHPQIPPSSTIEVVTSPRFIAAIVHTYMVTAEGEISPVIDGARKVLRQVKTTSVTDPLRYGSGAEMRVRDALVELLESTEVDVGKLLEEMELAKVVKEKYNGLV